MRFTERVLHQQAASASRQGKGTIPLMTNKVKWVRRFAYECEWARPLCLACSRAGAAVHPALRLLCDTEESTRGHFVITTQDLPANTPLISLPLHLSLATPTEELGEESQETMGSVTGMTRLGDFWMMHLSRQLIGSLVGAEAFLDIHTRAERQLAQVGMQYAKLLYNGIPDDYRPDEDVEFQGCAVPNLPYMGQFDASSLQARRLMIDFDRQRKLLQRSTPLEQLPYINWALSAVLSRVNIVSRYALQPTVEAHEAAVQRADTEDFVQSRQLAAMVPLLDFCNHSFRPTADIFIEAAGDLSFSSEGPSGGWVHLVSREPLEDGEEVTVEYRRREGEGEGEQSSDVSTGSRTGQPTTINEEEYWQMRWGFVPPMTEDPVRQRLRPIDESPSADEEK